MSRFFPRARLILALLIAFPVTSSVAWSRPISYSGGWSLMGSNQSDRNDLSVAYAPTPWLSVGPRYSRIAAEYGNEKLVLPMVNFLALRENSLDSQANVYLTLGYGYRKDDATSGGAGLGAVEADWESRKYHVSARYETIASGGIAPLVYLRARAGFSPYQAEFEGFHSWLLFELQEQPRFSADPSFGPLLRFYYQNVLFEIGSSLQGEWRFNWMIEL